MVRPVFVFGSSSFTIIDMPTVFVSGPYRLFFWAYDCSERRHIHVEHDDLLAKFWLEPDILLEDGGGFSRKELREVERIVRERKEQLIGEWNEFCGSNA